MLFNCTNLHPTKITETEFDPWFRKRAGEGNGNPLQNSCLEKPMERGAWWATVHGISSIGHDLATKPPPPPEVTECFFRSTSSTELYIFTLIFSQTDGHKKLSVWNLYFPDSLYKVPHFSNTFLLLVFLIDHRI